MPEAMSVEQKEVSALPQVGAGFNRWLIPVAAVCVHICIGSVYAWSTFNRPIKALFPDDPWWFSPPYTTFTTALMLLGLSAAFGRDDSSRALRESHEQTFAGWLNLSLEEQHADLTAYLETLEEPPRVVLDYWLRSRAYRNQPPASARTADRQLFYRNLEALLVVLKYASADAGPARGSSPPASPAR